MWVIWITKRDPVSDGQLTSHIQSLEIVLNTWKHNKNNQSHIWYSFTHTNYIKSNQTTTTPDHIGSRLVTILATGRWTSSAVTASAPGRLTSISGDFTSSASERFDFHQRWLHFISIGAFAIHQRQLHQYHDAWLPSAVTPSRLRRLTSSTVIFAWHWSQTLVHCGGKSFCFYYI